MDCTEIGKMPNVARREAGSLSSIGPFLACELTHAGWGDLVIVPQPFSPGERRAEISGRAKTDSLLRDQEAVCISRRMSRTVPMLSTPGR